MFTGKIFLERKSRRTGNTKKIMKPEKFCLGEHFNSYDGLKEKMKKYVNMVPVNMVEESLKLKVLE